MIKYQLVCQCENTFESWFASGSAFETLQQAGAVTCPTCGSTDVRKAIMAPNVSPKTRQRGRDPVHANEGPRRAPAQPPAAGAVATGPMPVPSPEKMAAFVEALREIRDELISKADDVGDRFPEEARKIHFEEVEPRAIYGQASPEEARDLAEDGVDFFVLPTLPEDRN